MTPIIKPALFVFCLVVAACGQAGARDAQLTPGRIVEISGPLSLRLAIGEEAVEIRLASLVSPVPERTQAFLTDLLSSPQVDVEFLNETTDRYQRRLGTIWLEAGGERRDLHTLLLAEGLVWLYPYPDAIDHLPAWRLAEEVGRTSGAGIWGEPEFRVRDVDPDMLMQDVGTIQIVAGRVTDAAVLGNGRVYLNFGSNYRTDFTIRIDAELAAAFTARWGDLAALEQRRIRVRGVIRDENGPMIIPPNSDRMEVLED
ncbi:thermonuclease family protein [Maricaulis sp. MIT060901]|uniref:thermonuclease family protein n=1 Tax=Maricaulis sp. MIT060901 TaxID=3096993 RepID=UPI003999C690